MFRQLYFSSPRVLPDLQRTRKSAHINLAARPEAILS